MMLDVGLDGGSGTSSSSFKLAWAETSKQECSLENIAYHFIPEGRNILFLRVLQPS
jgi:hypothetical protein